MIQLFIMAVETVLVLLLFILRIDAGPSVDCQNQPQASYPFCNINLTPAERATDIVTRLKTEELINQTSSIAPAIPELGIKDYNWRSNCLHGWSLSGGHWSSDLKWTVFPAPIGLGATFDNNLVQMVGAATADEGRALHNIMLAKFNGSSTEAAGLNCFSPNVNLLRDPRWGRFQESFSEDPYLLSVIGAAYTNGLQVGDDPNYLKVAACAKHYVVHSGPDNLRASFTAVTTMHDLYDTYLEAFKSQVYAGNVSQIMPAYSGFNCSKERDGAPDTANKFILVDVLRNQFEAPNISVISDNGGVGEVYATHHFAKTPQAAAALCMNATTDLDLGHDEFYKKYLMKALNENLVDKETIVAAVWRNFYIRILLGDFDPLVNVSYQQINSSVLDSKENQELNILAAQESIVLLKNKDGVLPLTLKMKKLAVIGPNANASHTLLSNYEGIPDKIVTVLEGITAQLAGSGVNVTYAPGCSSTSCSDDSDFKHATEAIKDADYVVMVMGLDGHLEGEGHDRVSHSCNKKDVDVLALPGCQGKLVDTIVGSNSHVILVLVNGGPLSLGDVYSNDKIRAVVEVFYPGALGGSAVASVLFGEYNPGGRMPITTYTSSKEVPRSTDYNMNTSPGRTYRYYTGTPEVPFGFGLSYTIFDYSNFQIIPMNIKQCDTVNVQVMVKNTGKMMGDEVVQAYLSPPLIHDKSFIPKIQLVGFNRQSFDPGDRKDIKFVINPYLLSLVDDDGVRYIFPGKYTIHVARALPGKSVAGGEIKGESGSFVIKGDKPIKLSDCDDAPKCIAC